MIGAKDLQTGKSTEFIHPFNTEEIQEFIDGYNTIIGHNIIEFDAPHLENFLGLSFVNHEIIDTCLLYTSPSPRD